MGDKVKTRSSSVVEEVAVTLDKQMDHYVMNSTVFKQTIASAVQVAVLPLQAEIVKPMTMNGIHVSLLSCFSQKTVILIFVSHNDDVILLFSGLWLKPTTLHPQLHLFSFCCFTGYLLYIGAILLPEKSTLLQNSINYWPTGLSGRYNNSQ